MQYDCVSRGKVDSLATSPSRQKEHKDLRTCIVFVNETNPRETRRVQVDLTFVQTGSKKKKKDFMAYSTQICLVVLDHFVFNVLGHHTQSTVA